MHGFEPGSDSGALGRIELTCGPAGQVATYQDAEERECDGYDQNRRQRVAESSGVRLHQRH
jgi:hypothetical protein